MDPHNKTTKDTHTHPPKTSSQSRPSLVLLQHLSECQLLGRHKPDQGEESEIEPSSGVSCGPSSAEGEGVPAVGEDENWCQSYSIIVVGVTCHEPMIVPSKAMLHTSHLQYPASQGCTFMTFSMLIMPIVLGESWMNLDIWPLQWVRYHNTLPIFQVRNTYFPLYLEIQNGINCPGYTHPPLLNCFLNIEVTV